jgi:excinuclease ABC subunit C
LKGIGRETKKKLLTRFKSIKRIREATDEEITELIGKSKATLIREWINEHSNKPEI